MRLESCECIYRLIFEKNEELVCYNIKNTDEIKITYTDKSNDNISLAYGYIKGITSDYKGRPIILIRPEKEGIPNFEYCYFLYDHEIVDIEILKNDGD